MDTSVSKLTVFFQEPFWVGIYERQTGTRLEVCKITFGAEPKDYEVWDFLLKNWNRLRFGRPVEAAVSPDAKTNPKRMQRQIKKQLQSSGVGTKAQQALKQQQEQGKLARKVRTREMREAEQKRQFALHREKCKEKHRGH